MNLSPAFIEASSKSFLETAILLQSAISASGGSGSVILTGPVASLPSPGTAGRVYITTDSNFFYYDNVTSWSAFGLINALTLPTTSLFPDIPNNGTLALSKGRVTFSAPASNTDNPSIAVGTVPGSTPYSVQALMATSIDMTPYHGGGITVYDSGSGKFILFGMVSYPSDSFCVFLNAYNAFNSGAVSSNVSGGATNPMWLKILNNGTTLSFLTSPDSETWTTWFSQALTAFMPAITHWGIFSANTNNNASTAICYSWLTGVS